MATLKTCGVIVLFLLCGCGKYAPADRVKQGIAACDSHDGAVEVLTEEYWVYVKCKDGVSINIPTGKR